MSLPHADLGHSFGELDSEESRLTKLLETLNPLWTSNDPPTKAQTDQISVVENTLLSNFLNVEYQIKRYEKMLAGLRDLQAKHQRLLKTCKGMRSLVRSLPNELLNKIFLECISDDGVIIAKISLRGTPMALCQVCRRWRGIALTSSQLWNRLTTVIGPALREPYHSRTLNKLMLGWFDRAKTLPLSLRFHLPYYDDRDRREVRLSGKASVAYNLFYPLRDRLQFLDLALAWAPCYLGLLPAESPFPQLETLILRRTGFTQGETQFAWTGGEPMLTFQNATRLRRVAMYYPIFANNIGNVPFPWTQLTHFIISKKIPHSVLEDLLPRSCVTLQQGVFHLTTTPSLVPSREVKTVQQHLIDLTITMDTSFNPGILRNFDFPALHSLRLDPIIILDEHWDERRPLYAHLSSIRRLSLQLKDYSSNKPLTCDEIVELLEWAPNTERLGLCPRIPYPDLMAKLTVDASSMPILPKLRSLSLDLGINTSVPPGYQQGIQTEFSASPFSVPALGKLVKSRWLSGAATCLEELQIYLPDDGLNFEIRAALKECMDEGFIVDERPAGISEHWSIRLKDEEISWREGLSVLVPTYMN